MLTLLTVACAISAKPNVLFLLTDDQDMMLGSMDPDGPLQKTRAALIDKGAYFNNGFANTPICCPSRAEIQTGRYMHNTKVYNNGCGGTEYVAGPEKLNVAHYAKQLGCVFSHNPSKSSPPIRTLTLSHTNARCTHRPAVGRYTTYYSGKYMNNYGTILTLSAASRG